jgi:sulfotransferase family protein
MEKLVQGPSTYHAGAVPKTANRIWRAKRPGVRRGWARQTPEQEYEAICRGRIGELVEVHEPFVLVSEVQRSGGTLTIRLFDGHPECHVHHSDMQIGYPRKNTWPRIPLEEGPDRWFDVLYEEENHKWLRGVLGGKAPKEVVNHPRYFLPRLQKAIFDHCVREWGVADARGALDAYFTSYFNAWLDNRNLHSGPKKAVVGFAPRMNANLEYLGDFFAAYPDGTLLSVIRDPRSWYASARTHKRMFADLDDALRIWVRSTESSLEAQRRFGERVLVVTFDQLVLDTPRTMATVAGRVGIEITDVLSTPTFNGFPTAANSTHGASQAGVLQDRTTLFRKVLDASTIARIEEQAGSVYERAEAASCLA